MKYLDKWYPIIKPSNAEIREAKAHNKVVDIVNSLPESEQRCFVVGLRNVLDNAVDKYKINLNEEVI